MKKKNTSLVFIILIFMILTPNLFCRDSSVKYKWFYLKTRFHDDNEVNRVIYVVNIAREHGYNGMVLAFPSSSLDQTECTERMLKLKRACDTKGVEIIPRIFSVGRGVDVLGINPNLSEGFHVEHDLYKVHGNKGEFIPELDVSIKNPGFEGYVGNEAVGYNFQEAPGKISFIDTNIKRSGKSSLRFENFNLSRCGNGRIMQEILVEPQKCYRVSCWIKTSKLKSEGSFTINVYGNDGRQLLPYKFKLKEDEEWKQLTIGFNSLNYHTIRVYAGVREARSGTFWLDDLHIENISMVNVLRRSGTPIKVKNSMNGEIYEEGKDYAYIVDLQLDNEFEHEGPSITILPKGRIKDGDLLDVSYYHSIVVASSQALCMSEPEVYNIWRNQLQHVHRIFSPKKYFLSMDEIREGGSCFACRKRNLSMSQILGDCVTKQYEMIKHINSNIEVFMWSDMFDPNHNGHNGYYYVVGGFDKSWKYIPRNIVMVCWGAEPRKDSLKHFSSKDFRTMAAAYYDVQDLIYIKDWLDELKGTPHSMGIMYTTWVNDYDLLGEAGDIVLKKDQ